MISLIPIWFKIVRPILRKYQKYELLLCRVLISQGLVYNTVIFVLWLCGCVCMCSMERGFVCSSKPSVISECLLTRLHLSRIHTTLQPDFSEQCTSFSSNQWISIFRVQLNIYQISMTLRYFSRKDMNVFNILITRLKL